MNLQTTIPLSSIYTREEDFSDDLADNLDALRVGSFEDPETESNVGTRRADIVAEGEDGILVVENQFGQKDQFGKADWDHWGRLEAYARSLNATVAVLVAERFEDLMIVTCNRRNEESDIKWYLIQVQANEHKELSFHHIARPTTQKKTEIGYNEFWQPIRDGEYGELFVGRPVYSDWIGETINRIRIWLCCNKKRCYVELEFKGENPSERRDKIMMLFPKSEYNYECKNTATLAVRFPVLDKGKNDSDDWNEIQEKLVTMGTKIYNKINESDL